MSNSASLELAGLDELRAQLRALPAELTDEGNGIARATGELAIAEIVAGYPEHDGDLKHGVNAKEQFAGRFGVAIQIRSTAKQAFWFENGTQVRHSKSHPNLGKMPAKPTFIPAMRRARRRLYEQLKGLLQRHGLQVSGDA